MKILGLEISRQKTPVPTTTLPASLTYGWLNNWPTTILEPFTGAWQRNMALGVENVMAYSAVYRCVTMIANDIGKLNLRLVEEVDEDIWNPVDSPAFSPVLRKQNHYQTRQDFIKRWMISKLMKGNTYVLKEFDNRGVVVALYVLDPFITMPLVADNGEVFYQCGGNKLAGINDSIKIPADFIIHDRNAPLFHDLCGLSPIVACGLSAMQALNSQASWNKFFANGSNPGGVLLVPGNISEEQAKEFKDKWNQNHSGPTNIGQIAVLGGGLDYKPMPMSAVDQELINQLKWSAENVCTAFGVPPYMIGVGPPPNYNNIEALNQQYYSQCLQDHIESIEAKLDEGLGLESAKDGITYGTEFDLDDLLRMDTKTQYETYGAGVKNSILSPNEARAKIGYTKLPGGDSIYMQQQNYSLEALAKRDAKADPFAGAAKPGASSGDGSASGDGNPQDASNPDGGAANDNANQDQQATNEQRGLWLREGANDSRA
jgi:HK97 family phage portal protein